MRHALARSCLGLLLVAASGRAARAQDDSAGPRTQIWANLTLGKTLSHRTYVELDISPKWELKSSQDWRSIEFTPLAEYHPASWLDLEAETLVGSAHQLDGLNTVEVTPRVGVRLHLFRQLVQEGKRERLPLGRLDLSTLIRLEYRNIYYPGDIPNSHEWRLRWRWGARLAINHEKLSQDGTLYVTADVEYYFPLGNGVLEQYVNKVRGRAGFGYRVSAATRLELLYVRDWNRTSPDQSASIETQAVDARLKLLF